jgi:hypothetical protein
MDFRQSCNSPSTLAPEADSFMPLRRARSDRVFEGPIVSTLKTIVGSFLDPSRAGGSVTVRFSTHRIKSDDFRVYGDPGYQHARPYYYREDYPHYRPYSALG